VERCGFAIPIGLVVLIRVRHTTTTVDGGARVLTIETRGLVGGATTETIPFDAIGSIVGRH
jgi:hypothetical protein